MYRVLLADDEQIERMALAKRLKRHFCGSLDISEAVNGAEALETFKREKSQIVVMDHIHGLLKVLVCLARKSHNNVRCQ